MKRVRVGTIYRFNPVGWDVFRPANIAALRLSKATSAKTAGSVGINQSILCHTRNINQKGANMTPLCAWCNTIPAGKLLDHGLVSHGICQTCSAKLVRELEISKLNALYYTDNKKGA